MSNNFDYPLQKPEEDSLGRDLFARKIFTLIDTVPSNINLRVGILGDWGSGKTKVMNFIKFYCIEKKHPVASFNPWQFHSKEDAWKGFVSCIDKGLTRWKKKRLSSIKLIRVLKNGISKLGSIVEIVKPEIGDVLNKMILSPLENVLEETKSKVTKVLRKTLNDKKLFVFIDDLDRADPEILYDLLMLLNEIFDISQCIYIISLDPKTISDVIKKKLNSINSNDFLDKIITWKFELPVPSMNDWKDLLERELKNSAQELDKEAITSIIQVLPDNPRKFKHLLRYLNSLHKGFLYRFDRDELDWKMLYLAQMLRLEFPDVFRKIMYDKEVLEDIAFGRLRDRAKEEFQQPGAKKNEGNERMPRWKERVQNKLSVFKDIDTNRFFKIYQGLYNCGGNTTPENVINHLHVIESPELMTWKEYYVIKRGLIDKEEKEIIEILQKSVDSNDKNIETERIREFLKMLMREHNQIWGNLVSLHTEEEIKSQLKEVDEIIKISNSLIDNDEIFYGINPIFDISIFKEWLIYLTKWAYFTRPEKLYKKPRDEEKKIIIRLVEKNLHNASEISDIILHEQHSVFSDRSKALSDVFEEVNEIIDRRLSDDLLTRFTRNNGIKEIWPSDSFRKEKNLIFKESSFFHTEEKYEELRILAIDARNNQAIHNNFIEMLYIIFDQSSGNKGIERVKEAQQLIRNKVFFSIIWDGATCKLLNRRTVGTMQEYINNLDNDLKKEVNSKRPKWWKGLIKDRI